MKKHTYRAKKVNDINWTKAKEQIAGGHAAMTVDIAKEKQYALLSTVDGVSELWHWNHPQQTREVLTHLESLECKLTVIMESTGTYGDALRYQFRRSGFDIHQISAKRVFDAKEVFDGVPSLHDAKSVVVMTRLYRDGVSKPWRESTDAERSLDALRREYDLYQKPYQQNQNRLEAYLIRHWPEVLSLLALDSVTLESLLMEYGSPEKVAKNAEEAAQKMKAWGKFHLKSEKIVSIVESAIHTLGQPCTDAEQRYLQEIAQEMRHERQQRAKAKQALESIVRADEGLNEVGKMIGLVTTAVLISCRLDPRLYNNARSYQKAMGLNLKEKSSGYYKGKLSITKRGCSTVRRYLYFAALRLIRNDSIIKAWYLAKVDAKARNKTVVALMRKISKALWYVGRGERFDANKLFTLATA
jgi:transposase